MKKIFSLLLVISCIFFWNTNVWAYTDYNVNNNYENYSLLHKVFYYITMILKYIILMISINFNMEIIVYLLLPQMYYHIIRDLDLICMMVI